MIQVSKKLFWDVEFKKLNYEKHSRFIIGRVLSFGDIKDYQIIKKKYGIKKLKSVAKKISYPNKKSLNFWSIIFNLPVHA
ncbi:hypothetical protein KAS79_02460 [Candidatus Parcubacteria bacterium]|nr:hypothetical protein [Candidatus Parcubacteria bacterium]